MGLRQIQDKLNAEHYLLEQGSPLREKDVVYFFVEARKAIEQQNKQADFRVLWFYANWVLHPQKNEIPRFVSEVFEAHKERIGEFVEMSSLRENIAEFLKEYGVAPIIISDALWGNFTRNLVDVLSEQPLILRGEVTRFEFFTTSDAGISYSIQVDS